MEQKILNKFHLPHFFLHPNRQYFSLLSQAFPNKLLSNLSKYFILILKIKIKEKTLRRPEYSKFLPCILLRVPILFLLPLYLYKMLIFLKTKVYKTPKGRKYISYYTVLWFTTVTLNLFDYKTYILFYTHIYMKIHMSLYIYKCLSSKYFIFIFR